MARRCLCARLLAALHEDPRLRTLPLAARMLFLLVAEAAARSPVPGVLPFGGTARVSLLVSAGETETQTHLETLCEEGLLVRGAADTLAVPLLVEATSRAEVARRNGARGGRPLKGETPEAYQRRKQGEMILPLPGGRGAEAETQQTQPPKPGAVAAALTATTVSEVVVSESPPPPARLGAEPDGFPHVALGEALAAMIGLDGSRGGFDYRPIQGWMTAGASAETIRAAVARVVDRPGFNARSVFSFKYFDRAVAEERARASAPARVSGVVRDTPEEAAKCAAIEARIARTVSGGVWDGRAA